LSSLHFFVVLNVVGCVVVVVLSVVFRRQALEIPLPCAGGGHFVTRIPLRLVLPLVGIKIYRRPLGGLGRSRYRYISHEVTHFLV